MIAIYGNVIFDKHLAENNKGCIRCESFKVKYVPWVIGKI